VVSVLARGPTAAGSVPAEDGGFLWAIKIRSTHFLRTGSRCTACKRTLQSMSEMLCLSNFPTPVSQP
jgi:hypothetical protein